MCGLVCCIADINEVYNYDPQAAVKWQALARGTYFTSCLTQCVFLSSQKLLTLGTDGHAVVWPLSPEIHRPHPDPSSSASKMTWQHPARIHQSSSKAMDSYVLNEDTIFIVSGGDDGSLAFVLARTAQAQSSTSPAASYLSPPITVQRAHASAVTSCIIIPHYSHTFILTSGNDEWVRLWEVVVDDTKERTDSKEVRELEDCLVVRRCTKIKTNVADVSSMALIGPGDGVSGARVLLCGVGMEIIRVDWEDASRPGALE